MNIMSISKIIFFPIVILSTLFLILFQIAFIPLSLVILLCTVIGDLMEGEPPLESTAMILAFLFAVMACKIWEFWSNLDE